MGKQSKTIDFSWRKFRNLRSKFFNLLDILRLERDQKIQEILDRIEERQIRKFLNK